MNKRLKRVEERKKIEERNTSVWSVLEFSAYILNGGGKTDFGGIEFIFFR